jgi:hypothetical protein
MAYAPGHPKTETAVVLGLPGLDLYWFLLPLAHQARGLIPFARS